MSEHAEHAEIVIVGGGVEGLAIAWSLADRGCTDVLVLERDCLCSGMTAKSSGVVRCHYGVRSLAAMAWYGVRVLAGARKLLGDEVGFRETGYVVGVGPENDAALRANVVMNKDVGIEVDLVDADTVAALWPGLRLDDFGAFAHEPHGGHGDPHMTAMAFARAAGERGVRIAQRRGVTALRVDAAGAVTGVETVDGAAISARTVILAAGVWSAPLARAVGVDIPVVAQREQILLVAPGRDLGPIPAFSDLVGLQYLRREPSGEILVGNSDHSHPELADPDRYRNSADDAYTERAVLQLDHRLPDLPAAGIAGSYSGCYDVTPDYNPIIGPTPVPGLVLAVGFSGHGYKISPGVGRLVADLVLEGASSDPNVEPHDFRLQRFCEDDPLLSEHPYAGAGQMR